MSRHSHKKPQKSGMLFKVVLPVAAALICAVISVLYLRETLSDEQKLEKIVHQLVDDAAHKNIRNILDRMAEDYSDSIYKSRKAIAEPMRGWAVHQLTTDIQLEAQNVKVVVEPSDTTATVAFNVVGNDPIEQIKRHYHSKGKVRLFFVKRDGEWLLKSMEPLD